MLTIATSHTSYPEWRSPSHERGHFKVLLSHFNRELDKTAIIFEFLGKRFRNLEKLFLDRIFPLRRGGGGCCNRLYRLKDCNSARQKQFTAYQKTCLLKPCFQNPIATPCQVIIIVINQVDVQDPKRQWLAYLGFPKVISAAISCVQRYNLMKTK